MAQNPIAFTCPPCGDGSCDGRFYDEPGVCLACNMAYVATFRHVPLPTPHAGRTLTVAILVYPGVDVMDLSGPYSVFAYAHMRIRTVAKSAGPVRAGGGLTLQPDYTFATFPGADILVVPGGSPAEENQDREIIAWVSSLSSTTILSVCSGAFFLAKGGVLDNLTATTFASLIPQLRQEVPSTHVVDDRRFVDNGRVITAAGLTSGIDGAFHLVERIYGRARTQQVANQMEYNWDPESRYVRAQLADRHLNPVLEGLSPFADSLISFGGNREFYEAVLQVSFSGKPAELRQLIEYNLSLHNSYRKRDGHSRDSSWVLMDNEIPWTLTINTMQTAAGVYRVKMRVDKNRKP